MSFLGSNIKVHFAGSDYQDSVIDSLKIAGVNYRLFTVYPAIAGKSIEDDFTDKTGVVERQQREFKHVILDSGLFTLMFGGQKQQKQTRQSLTEWQDKTFKFIQQNNFNGTLVEIDCQKVLGVEDAWFFRERARRTIKNRIINVFHYEDGKSGLERLIEFSDYIAISVPELRIIKPKTFRNDVHRIADYIKTKKPSIDIHLLGCTDKKMLQENRFCTTADSSSWTGVYRFANIQGYSAYNIKDGYYEDAERRYIEYVGREKWNKLTQKGKRRNVWELISAEVSKKIYEKYAGGQD
jgi:hypothetical protein